MILSDSVSTLKSVGKARLALLNKMGIYTIEDLVERLPRDYIDRTTLKKINEVVIGEENIIRAIVFSAPENILKGKITITKMKIGDETAVIEVIWFNQPYLKNRFRVNEEYVFTGRILQGQNIQLQSPDFELPEVESLSTGRIVPVYRTIEGITQKNMRALINQVLDYAAEQIEEFLPQSILVRYNLIPRCIAIKNLHFPECNNSYFAARRRLVFEELFILRFGLLNIRGIVKSQKGTIFKKIDIEEGKKLLPFTLTNAQDRVLRQIVFDVSSGFTMNRLIQGDVGSGKTAVAALACYIAVKNGYQVAVMAPTETLSMQHYRLFIELFTDMRVELLVGSISVSEKKRIKKKLEVGEIDIIIGTHALIQENVRFYNLGLVITDEQHRFGVRQRARLSEKGAQPHILIMSATPIPRTLALILYGDMDISIIDELPPGRQPIKTNAVSQAYRERIFNFIKRNVDTGQQAYIICPLVEQSENIDAISVEKYANELCKTVFAGYKTAILHGRMKPDDKRTVMEAFAANETSILISTTVVEVGVNVPNATVMLIENAERFGLAQLHQLRGRVGRGGEQSYCIMLSDSDTELTKQRLNAMVTSNDGFVLSELDLKLRGPGEFFGTAQHGLPEMLLANLYKDTDILQDAQDAAEEYLLENCEINEYLMKKITKKLGLNNKIEL